MCGYQWCGRTGTTKLFMFYVSTKKYKMEKKEDLFFILGFDPHMVSETVLNFIKELRRENILFENLEGVAFDFGSSYGKYME